MNRLIGPECIEIGDYCSFGNNLRLEAVTQYAGGSRFFPQIKFGNNVVINQNFHCTCADSLLIGDRTAITANCGIFAIIHPYDDIDLPPKDQEIKAVPVNIGSDCLIEMNSVILPGTRLGNHRVVGANSTVSGEFGDYCVLAGSPAKIIKKYDFEKKEWIKEKQ